ncbi:MAG: MFS transporter [Dehalococcoidales bacterium]|nr:MFS transporter [Dehalococcoidales bacterium]
MWTSLPWFIMAHFGHHLLTALPGPLLPSIRTEFGLNYPQSSIVTTAFALSGGASQLPSGWLADRINPVILLVIGTLGVAVGGILVGISTTYIMLIVFIIIMGLMTGGYHPASTPMILASVEPKLRGRALGLHLLGGNSSFFVAPLIAGGIMSLWPGWGWRGPFIILAIPTAIFGLIFYIYLTRRGGRGHAETARQRAAAEKPPQPGYKRRLIAYLVQMILGGGAGMSVNAFLALYMTDVLKTTDSEAAMLMSIMFIPGIIGGTVVGGWISDRIGTVRVIIATGILSGLIIFGLKAATLGFGFYLVLFVMGLIMAVRMPVTEVFIMSQTPARHRSTIYGVYYFTMQYTGAIFAPVMGWAIERYTFDAMFMFSAIAVTAVSVATSFFIWDAKD